MVKGLSRRVIVVDAPDGELFEQAIFIVREKHAQKGAVTAEKLVEEATRICRGYLNSCEQRKKQRPAFLWGFAGAVGVSLLWLIFSLLGG